LSKIYGCVKQVYPSFRSMHFLNSNFLEHLRSNKIELYSIEVLQ